MICSVLHLTGQPALSIVHVSPVKQCLRMCVVQDSMSGMQRGQCVLHVAASYGYPALVKTILQLKANVDCRDEVWSALTNSPFLGAPLLYPSLLQPAIICKHAHKAGHAAATAHA